MPEHVAESVPLVTVLTSPVMASLYVPFSTPVNVALPPRVTSTYESVVASV